MSHQRLLIVHPDTEISSLLSSMLQSLGHRIDEAPNDRAAVRLLEHGKADLVLAATDPVDPDALEFLNYLRRKHPSVPVILVFPIAHPERCREALMRGASAVLRYPLPATQLRAAVSQLLGQAEPAACSASSYRVIPNGAHLNTNGNGNGLVMTPQGHGEGMPSERDRESKAPAGADAIDMTPRENGETLIGDDPSWSQAVDLAGMIAPTPAPVLMVGERGTGKTLLARALHQRSPRHHGPFIEVSCGTLKESALEVELFGRKGLGPGDPDRPGKLHQARGGTIFLDEVANLSPALQYRLLRVLRDGEFEAVGSNQPERADVRLVVGTRENLATLVQNGQFRQDLYYRLGVVTLKLPPLRHRGADVERLAEHFRARFARSIGKPVSGFAPEALARLREHDWPGNVLELEHVVEHAVVLCRSGRIEPHHLVFATREAPTAVPRPHSRMHKPHVPVGILPLKEALEGPEKQLILQALEALNWNRQETARILDINRTTLYKKMKKYGLLFDEPAWTN